MNQKIKLWVGSGSFVIMWFSVPISFTMTGFQQKKGLNSSWYSPWFYTHPRGYKMCLRVDANGYGIRKNSHVSVYLYMMRGDYDESLKWPFRGDITIQLLNQEGSHEHHEVAIHFTDGTGAADNELCIKEVTLNLH